MVKDGEGAGPSHERRWGGMNNQGRGSSPEDSRVLSNGKPNLRLSGVKKNTHLDNVHMGRTCLGVGEGEGHAIWG